MRKRISGAIGAVMILSAALVSGCTSLDVTHRISPDFERSAPASVSVLPAIWRDKADGASDDGARVGRLISDLASDRVRSLGYSIVSPGDGAEANADDVARTFDADMYAGRARALKADAVLVPVISRWDRSAHIAGYVSFAFEAAFTMVSADGKVLWSSSFDAEESDMPVPMSVRSDREALQISLLKAYEARLQRYVDAAFATLPAVSERSKPRTYYDWLP